MINEEAMVAALEARNQEAQILGVLDTTSNANAPVGPCTLGEAFRFIANAPIVGYDARAARVMYAETGTPSLGLEIAQLADSRVYRARQNRAG